MIFMCALLAAVTPQVYSQARYGLSLNYGIDKPYQSGYYFGKTGSIQANVKLTHALAIGIGVGYETVRGKVNGPYNGYYFLNSRRSVELLAMYPYVRYYIKQGLFASVAPAIYLGGEEFSSSGLGGTLAAGYSVAIDKHVAVELSLFTGLLPDFGDLVPVGGLKAAIGINFGKR